MSEISSDRFNGYTKRFDTTIYNMAGRQGSRTLLVSLFSQWGVLAKDPAKDKTHDISKDKSLFSRLITNVALKEKFKELREAAKYTVDKVKGETIHFEAVYKIFSNQKEKPNVGDVSITT